MNQWDEERDEQVHSVLGRARAGLGPSASRKRAVLSSVAAGLGLPLVPPSGETNVGEGAQPLSAPPPSAPPSLAPPPSAPPATSSPTPFSTPPLAPETLAPLPALGTPLVTPATTFGIHLVSLKWIAAGLLSATAMGFGAGYYVAAPPPAPLRTHSQEESRSRRATTEITTPDTPQAEVAPVVLDLRGLDVPDQGPSRLAPKVTLGVKTGEPAKGEAKPSFYEELSYIHRAQSALQEGNGALALGLMTSLDEIRPRGALLVERNMTKVLALCRLERTDEARAIASRTLQSPSAEVYRRRLAGTCAGDAVRAPDQGASEHFSDDEVAIEEGKAADR